MLLDWLYPPACIACGNIFPVGGKTQKNKCTEARKHIPAAVADSALKHSQNQLGARKCFRRSVYLCESCAELFIPIKPPVCPVCGSPVDSENISRCASCAGKTFCFESNSACFIYEDIVRDVIHKIKFRRKKRAAEGCGALWADNCKPEDFQGIDVLAVVPIHRKRKRERGFNQAQVLADALSKNFSIPIEPKLLVRVKETRPLAGLNPRQRTDALSGAFAIGEGCSAAGKNICIVDDIFTTGATLNACAKILIENGAKKIKCMTFAIAVKTNDKN